MPACGRSPAAPLIDDGDPAKSERACADAERSLDRIAEAGGELARPGFAPHAIYSLSASARCAGSPSARRSSRSRCRSTSPRPRRRSRAARAARQAPGRLPRRVGLLGPRTVLAHGCWLDRAELELIAERGATVVTNPVANLKLAVGRRVPLHRRPPGGRGARPRNRRAGVEQLARPARLGEGVRPAAEGAGARPRGGDGRRRRWRSPPGGARGCSAAAGSASGPRRTSCSCAPTSPSSRSARSTPGSSTRRRVDRRHDRGRRAGADARRRGRGRGGGGRAALASARSALGYRATGLTG